MGHINNKSFNMDVYNSNFIIFTIKILKIFDIKIIERKKIIVYYFSDLGKCQTYVTYEHSINFNFLYHAVFPEFKELPVL